MAVEHDMRDRFGRYQIIRELARGGMGIVSLARAPGHAGFSKLAIVKELKPALGHDPELRTMFLDEARLAALLNHRNIVQTYEVGCIDDSYFMVLEYLEGCTLRELQKRLEPNRLPAPLAIRIAIEALAGLHHAHELTSIDGEPLGVVHRDVTPQNVFATFDGQVKLLDFGVAKTLDRQQVTRNGVVKGCIPYMSPEQASGDPVDRRADVFAMGVLLRETLSGERVWQGVSEIKILHRLLERDIPPFADDGVPPELQAICAKAMAPDAADRYPTAEAMRLELDRCLRSFPIEAGSLRSLGALVTAEFTTDREEILRAVRAHIALEPSGITNPSDGVDDVPATRIVSSVAEVSTSITHVSSRAKAMPGPGRGWLTTLLAGIATIAGTSALLVVGARVGSPPNPAGQAVDAVPTLAPPVAPAVETIEINIKATPSHASIFVDDVTVGQGQYTARYARGPELHRVRVAAPGHADATETVSQGASATVTIQLTKSPPATQPVAPAPKTTAPRVAAVSTARQARSADVPVVAPAPAPRAPQRSRQKLDTLNPYKD